jgi:2-aminoadipate transaminase
LAGAFFRASVRQPDNPKEVVMSTDAPIFFTRGNPDPGALPIDDFRECADAIFKEQGRVLFQYGHYSGYRPLREWIADWFEVTCERVLLGNSSMEFLTFAAALFVEKGDTVFLENPSYDRAITAMRRAGADVVGIPLEADGIDLAFLENSLDKKPPKLFYIVPDFQNPSGVTTSAAKRKKIAELAVRHGFFILEDAPYRFLRSRGEPPPTFMEIAPELTFHISSFSKIMSPGVRVGFLIGPPGVMPRFHKWSEDTYIHPSLVTGGIVYEYCRRGLLEPNIEKLKALYRPRLDCMLNMLEKRLPQTDYIKPEGGFFLSITLPENVDGRALQENAKKFGLVLSDGRGFFTDGRGDNFVRLPFCGISEQEIEAGVRRLAEAIRHYTH